MSNLHLLDTSNELLVQPFQKGVKLIKPNLKSFDNSHFYSVAQFLDLPFNVYFSNKESVLQNLNETAQENCNYLSVNDAIGKSIHDIAKKETVNLVLAHDREVVQKKEMIVKDVCIDLLNEVNKKPYVTFKFPWYDVNNEVIGNVGCAIPLLQAASLATSMQSLVETGLFETNTTTVTNPLSVLPGKHQSDFYFTRREQEISQQILLGRTAKQIALRLEISHRTVEFHIENLKVKLAVNTKADLIEKLYYFLNNQAVVV